jgi:hypothetical protein
MSLVKRFRLALQLLGEDASTFYFCDYKIISLGDMKVCPEIRLEGPFLRTNHAYVID